MKDYKCIERLIHQVYTYHKNSIGNYFKAGCLISSSADKFLWRKILGTNWIFTKDWKKWELPAGYWKMRKEGEGNRMKF